MMDALQLFRTAHAQTVRGERLLKDFVAEPSNKYCPKKIEIEMQVLIMYNGNTIAV